MGMLFGGWEDEDYIPFPLDFSVYNDRHYPEIDACGKIFYLGDVVKKDMFDKNFWYIQDYDTEANIVVLSNINNTDSRLAHIRIVPQVLCDWLKIESIRGN